MPSLPHTDKFIVLVSDTKSEMNYRVLAPPVTAHVEIPLPSTPDRAHFVAQYVQEVWID